MSLEVESARLLSTPLVRPMRADDLEAADRVLRLAFGTIRGLPDPSAAYGDADYVHTRFRAAPECAWVAEIDGDVVGSVFAARWGSFGFFGPLSVDPDLWDRGIGSRLLEPVLEAFASWDVRQAGLFTFADSCEASRPVPEARLLARPSHGSDREGGRPHGARPVRARLERSRRTGRASSSTRSAR